MYSAMRLPDTFPTDLVVLVAEDDAFARSLIAKMLATIGVSNVLLAADGEEALAILASGMTRVDVVVSDLHMPKRNGFELFDAVRAADPAMPFILVTGDARERAVAEARAREISAYVVKPLSPAQLREKLVATLGKDPAFARRNWPRTTEGLAFQREASDLMRTIYDIWRVGCRDAAMPPVDMLRRWGVERQRPFDRTTFAVEVSQPGPRLRYTFIGGDILARFGRDPTGEFIDEQSFLHRRYALPAYERVIGARVPHFRSVGGIEGFLLLRYRRLLLPFGDEAGVGAVFGCADLL
jgi:two-component system chemotaxis response regulator CheY